MKQMAHYHPDLNEPCAHGDQEARPLVKLPSGDYYGPPDPLPLLSVVGLAVFLLAALTLIYFVVTALA